MKVLKFLRMFAYIWRVLFALNYKVYRKTLKSEGKEKTRDGLKLDIELSTDNIHIKITIERKNNK